LHFALELRLTLFLAGLAVAQLVYGPLSDQYGRRPVVLAGLVILLLGTGICLIAPTIEVLIFGRVVQAVGGCAGMVIGRAMVRDLYDTNRSAQMIAYLTMASVVAPTLAPLAGGLLEQWHSWWASFVLIFVLCAGFLVFALIACHETLPVERRHQTRFMAMFRAFGVLLKNPRFGGYAFQVSFSTAAYFAFLGGSPYVLINLMGGQPAELGLYFIVVTLFYICGNFGTARLAARFGVHGMVMSGTTISFFGALVMLTIALRFGLTPVTFFGAMSIVAFGNGLSISSGTSGAISADPERVGTASGLLGSMQIGFSALGTYVAGLLLAHYATTPVPLIAIMVGFCAAGILSPIIGTGLARAR